MDVRGKQQGAVLGFTAARVELQLSYGEFESAVQLGEVRTVRGARPVVARSELDRLRAEEGFPDALRNRLRLVGTVAGAELLGISRDRFGKLARAGCLRPARWYVNRYRAVVWLYLATELRAFAEDHADLLTGKLPERLRAHSEAGGDLRARSWRARRVERLVADAADAWHEAAVWAALLGAREVARVVPDPGERERLRELLPALPSGRVGMYTAREVVDAQLVADDPEEIAFARFCLGHALERARAGRPVCAHPAVPQAPERPGGVWRRLLRGSAERRMRAQRSAGRKGPVAER